MALVYQYGGGACSLCGSNDTNKINCPLNPKAKHPSKYKHPLAKSPSPRSSSPSLLTSPSPSLTLRPRSPSPSLTLRPRSPSPSLTLRPRSPSPEPVRVRALPLGLRQNAKKVQAPVKQPVKSLGHPAAKVIFKNFFPIWVDYHINKGQTYKGMSVGTGTSMQARDFVDYIVKINSRKPDMLKFWKYGGKNDILEEMYRNQDKYFHNFELKGKSDDA